MASETYENIRLEQSETWLEFEISSDADDAEIVLAGRRVESVSGQVKAQLRSEILPFSPYREMEASAGKRLIGDRFGGESTRRESESQIGVGFGICLGSLCRCGRLGGSPAAVVRMMMNDSVVRAVVVVAGRLDGAAASGNRVVVVGPGDRVRPDPAAS